MYAYISSDTCDQYLSANVIAILFCPSQRIMRIRSAVERLEIMRSLVRASSESLCCIFDPGTKSTLLIIGYHPGKCFYMTGQLFTVVYSANAKRMQPSYRTKTTGEGPDIHG